MMFIVLFCLKLSLVFASEENVIDESCETSCDKTYPLHTYPTVENLDSCKRGCRLSTLIHFVHDNGDGNDIKDLCITACKEAYNQSYKQYACNVGCSNQEIPNIKYSEKLQNKTSMELVFQSIFQRMMSSKWILYVDRQDPQNSVIVEDISSSDGKVIGKSEFSDSWMTSSNSESSDWFPEGTMAVACFYDFLHFVFFKIIALFLIFLFILTVLTLLHITLNDFKKNQQGYISFIESAHYSINHSHGCPKLEV